MDAAGRSRSASMIQLTLRVFFVHAELAGLSRETAVAFRALTFEPADPSDCG